MVKNSYAFSGRIRRPLAALALVLAATAWSGTAFALSEIQREDVPVTGDEEIGADDIQRRELPPIGQAPAAEPDPDTIEPPEEAETAPEPETPGLSSPQVPLPDPIVRPRGTVSPATNDPDETAAPSGNPDDDVPIPEIQYDVEALPQPVKDMRARIMEAALTGELENLRPLIKPGNTGTQLSVASVPTDPVAFLRSLSGDEGGQEILAILYEVLAAGYVHMDEGQPSEAYVWPYFFAVPLDSLDSRQRVELFRLVTAGDYEDMKNFGAYIFYRVGIAPDGSWLFFVSGD